MLTLVRNVLIGQRRSSGACSQGCGSNNAEQLHCRGIGLSVASYLLGLKDKASALEERGKFTMRPVKGFRRRIPELVLGCAKLGNSGGG